MVIRTYGYLLIASGVLGQKASRKSGAIHFYQALGQRIAQQTLAHYEVGRLRVAAAMLPAQARALSTSIEELLGEEHAAGKGKRGPAPSCSSNLNRSASSPRPSSAL